METRSNQTNVPASESFRKFDDVPGSTPREKLQNAHARLRATASAGPPVVSDSVTPSSAGDIEPVPPVSFPQTTLPLSTRAHGDRADLPPSVERHAHAAEVVVPPALLFPAEAGLQTIQPSAIFERTENAVPGSLRLGPSEFAVTLPMDSRSKDEYAMALAEYSSSVKLLMSGFKSAEGLDIPETEQAQTLSNVKVLIEKLDNIAVHPDLNIASHVKQAPFEPPKEASYAEYSSAKFLFLGQLIEVAGAQDLHIIIMVRGGERVELVERYFQGKGFIPIRPVDETRGYTEVSLQNGMLSVGILSAHYDGIVESYRPPAVIFALDSSFNASNPSVEHLRTTYARHGNLLPVVHLLISNSSEHIQRCLPELPADHNDRGRLKLLLQIVMDLREFLGDLQDDALGVQDNADEVFTFLMSEDFNTSWHLPVIEPLSIRVSDDMRNEDGPSVHLADPTSTVPSTINKRIFDSMDNETPDSKRQRLHMSQDLTQTTESTAGPSQVLNLTGDLKAVEEKMLEMKAEHATEFSELRNTISELRDQLKGWEDLQHRYESRNKEFHKLRKELDNLTLEKAKVDQRAAKYQEETSKLKDERTQLKHDLESARNNLKAEGGLKEELEKAREEMRQLAKRNAEVERKAEIDRKQAEYTREQYQNASSEAVILANERNQLKAENEDLGRKLAADATKLREIRMQNDEHQHMTRVKELEQTLELRDTLLRKKEEELRSIRNNRPATRATSTQPRSPKSWGNNGSRPTSPGINNNGVGNRGSSGLRFSAEMSF